MIKTELHSLTGLRFWLASWVVLAHQSGSAGYLEQAIHHIGPLRFIAHGGLAVSCFFCLSGFILTYNYGDSTFSPSATRRFYLARFARIYPAYFFSLVVYAPVVLRRLQIGNLNAPEALTALLLTLALVQAFFPRLVPVWNGPAWSLSAEAFFYTWFPWIVKRVRAFGWGGLLVLALSMIVVSLPATPEVVRWLEAKLQAHEGLESLGTGLRWYAGLLPLVHIPQFILGIIAGVWFLRSPRRPSRMWRLLVWGSLAVVYFLTSFALPIGFESGALFAPCFILLIVGLAIPSSSGIGLLDSKPTRFLGEASYAMYILHIPLAFYVKYIDQSVLKLRGEHPVVLCAIYFAVVVLVSCLCYLYVERPLRRLITSKYVRGSSSRTAPAADSVAIGPP